MTAVVDPRAGWGWTVTFDLYKQPVLDHLSSWQAERRKEGSSHHAQGDGERHSWWSLLLVVCLRLSLSSCVHVYVYTFPLAAFHIRSSSHSWNVWAMLCFDSVRFLAAVAGVLLSGSSTGSASHMFIHTDTSKAAHEEVKRPTEKIASAVAFQAFIEDETTFAVIHDKEKKICGYACAMAVSFISVLWALYIGNCWPVYIP